MFNSAYMHDKVGADKGFSLLELLLVVAMLAVMVSVALPMWQQPQTQVHRQQAWMQLQRLALAQDMYLSQTGHLAETVLELPVALTADSYQYSLLTQNGGWTVVAVVKLTGRQNNDVQCARLQIDQDGNQRAFTEAGTETQSCN